MQAHASRDSSSNTGTSEKALLLAEMQKNEIAHYEKYKAYYGYVFYIGQKPEE